MERAALSSRAPIGAIERSPQRSIAPPGLPDKEVPICLLYAATNNLFAVSLYHAIVNLKEQLLLQQAGLGGSTLFVWTASPSENMALYGGAGLGAQLLAAFWIYARLGRFGPENASADAC